MVLSSPAVVNGVVYVGSDDNNLYALNASTGAKLWSYRTALWVEANPAITNGVVYVGSDDGNVYAFSTVSSTAGSSSGGFLGLPGFEAVYAVAGVLAVAYVLTRRRR
jgi:PGF-CTERM protein